MWSHLVEIVFFLRTIAFTLTTDDTVVMGTLELSRYILSHLYEEN